MKKQESNWIPCSERLPENEVDVEVTCMRKRWKTEEPMYFTARAFYTDGKHNTEESRYTWHDCDNWEIDSADELEAYIVPEGWWESVIFGEEFVAIDCAVIAWLPLPEPYKGESK